MHLHNTCEVLLDSENYQKINRYIIKYVPESDLMTKSGVTKSI